MWKPAVRVDSQFAGLVNERPQRESGIAAVHHHAHSFYRFCRAPSRRAPPWLVMFEANRVSFASHTVEANTVGWRHHRGVIRSPRVSRVHHTVFPKGLCGMRRRCRQHRTVFTLLSWAAPTAVATGTVTVGAASRRFLRLKRLAGFQFLRFAGQRWRYWGKHWRCWRGRRHLSWLHTAGRFCCTKTSRVGIQRSPVGWYWFTTERQTGRRHEPWWRRSCGGQEKTCCAGAVLRHRCWACPVRSTYRCSVACRWRNFPGGRGRKNKKSSMLSQFCLCFHIKLDNLILFKKTKMGKGTAEPQYKPPAWRHMLIVVIIQDWTEPPEEPINQAYVYGGRCGGTPPKSLPPLPPTPPPRCCSGWWRDLSLPTTTTTPPSNLPPCAAEVAGGEISLHLPPPTWGAGRGLSAGCLHAGCQALRTGSY